MEQHPIPRQITTFEFKLIGFMTLTQFIYLVVFIPASYIIFRVFPVPLLNVLLAFVVAAVGVGLAFLPVNGRPLDVWIRNLVKRLLGPTQYFYHKENPPLYYLGNLYFDADPHKVSAHVESQEKLAKYLTQTAAGGRHAEPKFMDLLEQTKTLIAQFLQKPHEELIKEASSMQPELQPAPQVKDGQPEEPKLHIAQVAPQEQAPFPVTPPLSQAPTSGLKKPFFAGVVKNAKGMPLSGILIYVKDVSGTPLRLLKSNPYGVFATYNAIFPGPYTFELKDPKGVFFFDTMKINIQEKNEPLEFYSRELIQA